MVKKYLTGHIDFDGQERAKKNMKLTFLFGYIFSLIIGFLKEDLRYTLALGVITNLMAILIVVPPWWFYRKSKFRFKKIKEE